MIFSVIFIIAACNNDDEPSPANSNIQQYVGVARNAGSDNYEMTFSKQGKWKVYQGTSPDNIDIIVSVGETTQGSLTISGLNTTQRYYFIVELDSGDQAMVSETQIAVMGQPNFRDLGGIITKEGKSVKWGKIYRSGELNRLTEDDKQYMASMKIDKLIDFRFDEEIDEAPDNIPEGIEVVNLPVKDSLFTRAVLTSWLISSNKEGFDTLLIHANRVFVTEFQNEFSEFMKSLETGPSLVFHCTYGKDRTGYATALFLSALGVDREKIIEEYLESNTYLDDIIEQTIAYVNSLGLNGELLRPTLEVKREYLENAFSIIDSQYGGMDNYLRNTLGVDVDRLKALYLE
jgi:protein-tyrosine phosphatase